MSSNNQLSKKKGYRKPCFFNRTKGSASSAYTDYSNGNPPRDNNFTNSSVTNVSTVGCSISTNTLNANAIISNDQGSSLWTAIVDDIIVGVDPTQIIFKNEIMLNRGIYPFEFIPNVNSDGTFQVSRDGIYNMSLSLDIEFDQMPEGMVELVESSRPEISLMYVDALDNGFYICLTITGMVRLKANTDYQFNIHFQMPATAHNTVYQSFFIERIY